MARPQGRFHRTPARPERGATAAAGAEGGTKRAKERMGARGCKGRKEEIRAARTRIEENMEANTEILMQGRTQRQQEEELREVAKLQVAKKAAKSIAERLRVTPY